MSDITPLLLDAKKEYTSRLEELFTPQLTSVFGTLYQECVEEGSDVFICFQSKLKQVPFWNISIIQQRTHELITSYTFFENLVCAVLVTWVKVLSAIRLGSDRPSVTLKLPQTDAFVHEVYKQMAQILYYEPFIMENRQAFDTQAVPEAIERSIRRLIPYDDILESYLAAPDPEPQNNEKVASDSSSSDESESESSDDDDKHDINVNIPSNQVPNNVTMPHDMHQPAGQTNGYGEDHEDSDDDVMGPPYPAPPAPAPAPQQHVPPQVALGTQPFHQAPTQYPQQPGQHLHPSTQQQHAPQQQAQPQAAPQLFGPQTAASIRDSL